MFCDQNGMEMNNRKIFLIPIKGIYEKPKTNIILNDETLNTFSLTRDKKVYSLLPLLFSIVLEIMASVVR